MNPYFLDDAAWERMEEILFSWKGTPYRHMWMRKNRGADCALFVGAVLQEAGILTRVSIDFYPKDWFVHTRTEVVRNGFEKNCLSNVAPGFSLESLDVEEPELMRGDIVGFSTFDATGVTNHTGIMLDGCREFMHVLVKYGVLEATWGNWWMDRLTLLYRVMT